MAKPVKPAKKKKSGNLLVHVVILLLLATVGWRLYALQGQVRAAQAERDQYARQVENVQQENETLRSDIAEGPTEEKMKELAREELGMIDSNCYLFLDRSNWALPAQPVTIILTRIRIGVTQHLWSTRSEQS